MKRVNGYPLHSTVKSVLSGHSKRISKIGFQCLLSLNAGQQYCREHSAILSTFIKLQFSIKTVLLSNFRLPLKTDFTVLHFPRCKHDLSPKKINNTNRVLYVTVNKFLFTSMTWK